MSSTSVFRATSSHKDWPGIPTSKYVAWYLEPQIVIDQLHRVGDFGLATWLDDEDTQIMTGTMGWFAPVSLHCATESDEALVLKTRAGSSYLQSGELGNPKRD